MESTEIPRALSHNTDPVDACNPISSQDIVMFNRLLSDGRTSEWLLVGLLF